jgi:hypothetical protein
VLVATACYLLTSLETRFLFLRLAPGGQDYFKVASFLYEFLTVCGLLLLSQQLRPDAFLVRALRPLAQYAYFIYLIHLPVVPKFLGMFRPETHFSWRVLVLSIALCLAIPVLLTNVARALPLPSAVRTVLIRLTALPA